MRPRGRAEVVLSAHCICMHIGALRGGPRLLRGVPRSVRGTVSILTRYAQPHHPSFLAPSQNPLSNLDALQNGDNFNPHPPLDPSKHPSFDCMCRSLEPPPPRVQCHQPNARPRQIPSLETQGFWKGGEECSSHGGPPGGSPGNASGVPFSQEIQLTHPERRGREGEGRVGRLRWPIGEER